MSDENAPVTITLKGGAGFDQPWIVLRGDTPEHVVDLLRNLGELPGAVIEAANLFHGASNLAPVVQNAPQQAAPAAAPAPQQQAWGQQAPQPPAPQGGGRSYGTPHPEGKQCEVCGQVLEAAQTRTGKKQWKCNAYRWNNGNPNGHTLEWVG